MIRRIIPIVANTLLILSGTNAASDEANSSSLAFELAKTTLDRIMAPPQALSDVDKENDKNNSVGEKTQSEANGNGATEETNDKQQPTKEDETKMEAEDKNLSYDGSDLIEWINNNGGYIHPNARIGLDPTGQYRGVFVKNVEEEGGTSEGIEEGDTVARIPWDLIIKPKNYSDSTYWSCEALHEIHRQFLLGDESPYAPYVNYLKNQPRGRIPAEWTDAGKQLLQTIQSKNGQDDESSNALPPKGNLKSFEETWIEECKGEDTPLARAAYYQFTSRDEDTLMVPFYDMHNHSNDPKKLNTISAKPKRKGKPFYLRTIRDIAPGEQIFISYNRCNACWFDETYKDCTSYSHYGTPQLFDIFGFVEEFPQMWSFEMNVGDEDHAEWDDLKFCLEKRDDDGPLLVTFGDNYSPYPDDEVPHMGNVQYLSNHLVRLTELESSLKEDSKMMESMPKYEWDMAWTYHQAVMTSISAAMLASGLDDEWDEEDGEDEDRIIVDEEDSSDDSEPVEDEEDSSDDSEPAEEKKKEEVKPRMKGQAGLEEL
eukprot:CAMPEP_0172306364 /NCGR_PEP_ID=MMETSP1058-20130122/7441_1 /TAXON_ID=83371 /ORGANISM="Detonula confervacea, Strain CCMP 353" /LENGTH=540 /DNA_ID=CAMNT_0013018219 /DNA_START=146 /DNA_END=1768 /DNA_ORIENTATION=-